MRVAALLVGLVVMCSLPTDARQDNPDDFEHMFKCTLRTVKPMYWCPQDYTFLKKDDVLPPSKKEKRKKPVHKDTEPAHELEVKKACIQVYYRCPSHMDSSGRRPARCKEKGCKEKWVKVEDLQVYLFRCLGCGASSEKSKKDVPHQQGGGDHNTIASCEGAGNWPHSVKEQR